jgi:hypothetical protein
VPGNNRVFYGCLGVAECGSAAYERVISGSLSLNRAFSNIFAKGRRDPVSTYGEMPNVEFTYSQYLSSFTELADENGINDPTGFDLIIGDDTDPFLSGNNSTARCSFALLNSVTYNLPVNAPFTVERKYIGLSKLTGSAAGLAAASTGTVFIRQAFGSGLPAGLGQQALQNISINFTINRTPVNEFATRKPYASYVNFPLETTVTFEMLTQSLDTYAINALESACQNPLAHKQDITIALCDALKANIGKGASITIPEAYLTNLNYSGADAGSNSNQTLSATFTSYKVTNSKNIKPVTIMPTNDPCA